VTWTWQGLNQHNVTFDNAAIGNSSTKSSGAFTRMFDSAGEFTYYCTVHGRGMSGKVTVTAPSD
jgi:plastocyanin